MNTHWQSRNMPALRHEAAYGDRIVRCFVERPGSMHALLEHAVAAHGQSDAVVCGDTRWSYRQLDEIGRASCRERVF